MRMLLAGNWKMNGVKASLAEIRALTRALAEEPAACDILVCPPSTLIAEAVKAADGTAVAIGGQDCHALSSGAYTGDIAAEMLRDAGAVTVIVGHSERRHYHGETNLVVAAKVKAAARAGLSCILCIGESEKDRAAGRAVATVTAQLKGSLPPELGSLPLTVAYEPVWAIGTGAVPKSQEIFEMHEAVRMALDGLLGVAAKDIRILYGGSVKPENAAEILAIPNVNGALIGGASLKAAEFLAIIRSASPS
jgi:triosephosphate isomerase